jgi:hypothetical protein
MHIIHGPSPLELDIALPLDKSSVPWNVFLTTCKLSEELGMRFTIELHARQTTFCIALVRVEEAITNISRHLCSLLVEVKLTDSQP